MADTRADDAALHFGEKREFVPYGVYNDGERVEPSLAPDYTPPLYIEPEIDIALPEPIRPRREIDPPVVSERYAEIDSRIDDVLSQISELEAKLGEQQAANEMKINKAASPSDETAAKLSSLNG